MTDTTPTSLATFYDHLAVPESCLLGKRLFKKQFYENAQLNATDKKTFIEDIDNIEWRYTLKPTTLNIPRFEDENHEYLEVALLQVTISSGNRYKRIAEVMQKAIPYPLLIVFVWENEGAEQIALNAADKRINRADSNKIVVESLHDTGWINLAQPEAWQQVFLDDFQLGRFSYRNLYDFYQDIVRRIVALNCATHTGHYELAPDNKKTDRLDSLRQLEQLQQQRAELRNKLKKEKNMGTQVQLNTQVKQINDRIESIKQAL
jgi:DNA uptake protein ComE-like DNA-binding protein